MSANSSYGGVRAGVSIGRFGAQAQAAASTDGGTGRGLTGGIVPNPGSPYQASPTPAGLGPPVHHALLALVALEVAILVGLRGGFRHYHGG